MEWFAAHIVLRVVFKTQNQSTFPAWENVYLIEAPDEDIALSKAESIGLSLERDGDCSFEWNGQPARWSFCGVRKLISLVSATDPENKPTDGCEVTYASFEFESEKAVEDFVNCEETLARIL
ncbi:hypothetical protein GCM10027277_52330 [Pseudoduganella ginsengisoli]|nr:DUF4288 domain-containing protein [Pseudoduganella ginsengisoli]